MTSATSRPAPGAPTLHSNQSRRVGQTVLRCSPVTRAWVKCKSPGYSPRPSPVAWAQQSSWKNHRSPTCLWLPPRFQAPSSPRVCSLGPQTDVRLPPLLAALAGQRALCPLGPGPPSGLWDLQREGSHQLLRGWQPQNEMFFIWKKWLQC